MRRQVERNNFNWIAPYYDHLAGLVFGGDLIKSQRGWADEIHAGAHVLIVGGGTGRLLDFIPSSCEVTYLEKSDKMIAIARKKEQKLDIQYIHQDFLTWQSDRTYDFILCPFFLDCFQYNNLEAAVKKSGILLSKGGKLLVADFDKDKTESLLSVLMHKFFKITSSLESGELQDINSVILKNGFFLEKEEFFRRSTIFSRVYGNL